MSYTISSLDFCAIAGVSPYDSPISLFLKKQGKIPSEKEETFYMRLGKKMEKVHRELLHESGLIVVSGDFNLRKHPNNEAFIAVPDGFVQTKGGMKVIENKTCLHGYVNNEFFETQLRWEMFVCQCDGVLTILTPNDLYIRELYRDQQWEAEAERLALQYLELLEKNELPSVDNYHPATFNALRQVEREEKTIEIPLEMEKVFQKIEELNSEIKQREEAIEMLKSQLLIELGEANEGTCGNYRIKVINYERKPSITISEVNDDVIRAVEGLGVKHKVNEGGRVVRVNITNLNK